MYYRTEIYFCNRKFMARKIKKISSKVDYKCPYFEIVKEKLTLANGKNSDWYFLKRKDFVIIIAKDGNYTYMVELYRFSIKKKSLEFPAGYIEKGENPLSVAKRELKEETGITANKFTYLGWYYSYVGMSDQKAYVFLAEDIAFTKQKLEEAELGMKVKKIKISKVGNSIRKGKIRSAHSINSFYIYKLKGKK